MILPHSHTLILALVAAAALCWGSWANAYKLGRWRFEVFYFDFAIGALLAALIYAFTVGSLGFDGFTLLDDLLHAGKRQWAYGFGAGVIFNLGNMLMMAAISIAGMAIAFPAALGIAFAAGACLNHLVNPSVDPAFLSVGCALVLAAVAADAFAYRTLATIRHEERAKAGKASTRRPGAGKVVVVALAAGLLMGLCLPVLEKAKEGELGLGPYAVAVVLAAGLFFSTFIFNLFFMNIPVEGEPVEMLEYLKATLRQHAFGVGGGAVWGTGAVACLVAASATREMPSAVAAATSVSLGPAAIYAATLGAAIVAALWGAAAWKDFRAADSRVKFLAALMFALLAGGLGVIAMAPAYARSITP